MFEKLKARIATQFLDGLPPEDKSVIGANLVQKSGGDANWFVHFLNLANKEDAYSVKSVSDPARVHAWVQIGIDAIVRNIARAPFRLYNGDTVIETGPVFDLFEDVNPYLSKYQLWEATVAWRILRGEAFWTFGPDFTGTPQVIYVTNPEFMHHHLDPRGEQITLWTFERDNQKIPFLPHEVIHFRKWNKWDEWRGISDLVAGNQEISQDRYSNIANTNLIANNQVPKGVIQSTLPLSIDQAREVKERWRKEYGGLSKYGDVAVLGHGATFAPMMLSNADMQYIEMRRWNRVTILTLLGVPLAVAGVKDPTSNLSGEDTKEQLKSFWSNRLIPEIRFFEDKLRTDFFNRYKIPSDGRFDLTSIDELQEDDEKKRLKLREDVKVNILTINEAREELGRDPVPWGDVAWMSMALVPVETPDLSEPEPVPPQLAPPEDQLSVTITDVAMKELISRPVVTEAAFKKDIYTEEYKVRHWKALVRGWERIEKEFEKDLRSWFYDQRSHVLRLVFHEEKQADPEWQQWIEDLLSGELDENYWISQNLVLSKVAEKHFIGAMEFSGVQLIGLFQDLGIEMAPDWSIYNTAAVKMLQQRVNEGKLATITQTMQRKIRGALRDGIEGGWSEQQMGDAIRDVYNAAGNRAKTIARTELGGVISDSREAGFVDVGVKKQMWVSARDGRVRTPGNPEGSIWNHRIDGQVRAIGEAFDTGGSPALTRPNMPGGEAGDVINCRCIVIPVLEK